MPKEEKEKTKKNKWTTPQLIVLVRGKPEEGVLAGCKRQWGAAWGGVGPTGNAYECSYVSGPSCYMCSAGSNS